MDANERDYILLGPYRKLCERLDRLGYSCGEEEVDKICKKFSIELEKVRRKLFPSASYEDYWFYFSEESDDKNNY